MRVDIHSLKERVFKITTCFSKPSPAGGRTGGLNLVSSQTRSTCLSQGGPLIFPTRRFLCSPGLVSPEVLAAFACSDPQPKTVCPQEPLFDYLFCSPGLLNRVSAVDCLLSLG